MTSTQQALMMNPINNTPAVVASININGLKKSLNVLSQVADLHNFDIICLQETHLQEKDVAFITQFWSNKRYWPVLAATNSGRAGVGFVVRKSVGSIVSTEFCPNGNWGFTSIRLNCGRCLNLLNIYAPQNHEQEPFWNEIEDVIESLPDDLIMLGDFNNKVELVDLTPGASFSNNERQCKLMLDSFGFDDVILRFHHNPPPTFFSSPRAHVVTEPVFAEALRANVHLSDEQARRHPRQSLWKLKTKEGFDQAKTLRYDDAGAAAVKAFMRDSIRAGLLTLDEFAQFNQWSQPASIVSRIDRIYASPTFSLPLLSANSIGCGISDHHAVFFTFNTTPSNKHGPGYFKLRNDFVNDKDVRVLVVEVTKLANTRLADPLNRIPPAELLSTILPSLRRRVRDLQVANKFAERFAEKVLNDRMVDFSLSQRDRLIAEHELGDILRKKAREQVIKSRLRIDLDLEKPSPFLTRRLAGESQDNYVTSLKDPVTGVEQNDGRAMAELAATFYERVFSKRTPEQAALNQLLRDIPPVDCGAINNDLLREMTNDEISYTIDKLPSNSSPGIDGFGNSFLKEYSKELMPLLKASFNSFLRGSPVPEEWAKGVIVTIWKRKGDPADLDNRRPITLLNNVYKLFTRILADRLAPYLGVLISKEQTGFVRGRSIFENVKLVLEAIRQCKKKKLVNSFLLFLDLEKAYDRVSIESIAQVMEKTGIDRRFTNLVRHLGSIGKAQVLVNGFLSRSIELQSGVRQGDPLSPLLFNFAMELLLRPLLACSSVRGLPVFENKSTKAVLYADDSCLLGSGHSDFNHMQRILKLFQRATCSKVNINKSFFLAPHECRFDHSPYPVMPQAGEKYLGFTVNKDGLVSTINARISQVINDLKRWRAARLSLFGNVIIVKTYAYSRLLYHMRFDWPSDSWIDKLQNCINWFLWHSNSQSFGTPENRNRKWAPRMKAARYRQPRELGGLNLLPVKDLVSHYKAWFAWSVARDPSTVWYKHVSNALGSISGLGQPLQGLQYTFTFKGWPFLKNSLSELQSLIKKQRIDLDAILNAKSPFKLFRKSAQSPQPVLTPSQEQKRLRYNIKWKQAFGRVRRFKVRGQIKSFYFKILNNCTPWMTDTPCGCGSNFDSFWHVSTCRFWRPIRKHIQAILTKHFSFTYIFDRPTSCRVPESTRSKTLISIALWCLWRVRNKYIYEGQAPSIPFTENLFYSELLRALQLQFRRQSAKRTFAGMWMQQRMNSTGFISIQHGQPTLNR